MKIEPHYGPPQRGPLEAVTLTLTAQEFRDLRAIAYLVIKGSTHTVSGRTLDDYKPALEILYDSLSIYA